MSNPGVQENSSNRPGGIKPADAGNANAAKPAQSIPVAPAVDLSAFQGGSALNTSADVAQFSAAPGIANAAVGDLDQPLPLVEPNLFGVTRTPGLLSDIMTLGTFGPTPGLPGISLNSSNPAASLYTAGGSTGFTPLPSDGTNLISGEVRNTMDWVSGQLKGVYAGVQQTIDQIRNSLNNPASNTGSPSQTGADTGTGNSSTATGATSSNGTGSSASLPGFLSGLQYLDAANSPKDFETAFRRQYEEELRDYADSENLDADAKAELEIKSITQEDNGDMKVTLKNGDTIMYRHGNNPNGGKAWGITTYDVNGSEGDLSQPEGANVSDRAGILAELKNSEAVTLMYTRDKARLKDTLDDMSPAFGDLAESDIEINDDGSKMTVRFDDVKFTYRKDGDQWRVDSYIMQGDNTSTPISEDDLASASTGTTDHAKVVQHLISKFDDIDAKSKDGILTQRELWDAYNGSFGDSLSAEEKKAFRYMIINEHILMRAEDGVKDAANGKDDDSIDGLSLNDLQAIDKTLGNAGTQSFDDVLMALDVDGSPEAAKKRTETQRTKDRSHENWDESYFNKFSAGDYNIVVDQIRTILQEQGPDARLTIGMMQEVQNRLSNADPSEFNDRDKDTLVEVAQSFLNFFPELEKKAGDDGLTANFFEKTFKDGFSEGKTAYELLTGKPGSGKMSETSAAGGDSKIESSGFSGELLNTTTHDASNAQVKAALDYLNTHFKGAQKGSSENDSVLDKYELLHIVGFKLKDDAAEKAKTEDVKAGLRALADYEHVILLNNTSLDTKESKNVNGLSQKHLRNFTDAVSANGGDYKKVLRELLSNNGGATSADLKNIVENKRSLLSRNKSTFNNQYGKDGTRMMLGDVSNQAIKDFLGKMRDDMLNADENHFGDDDQITYDDLVRAYSSASDDEKRIINVMLENMFELYHADKSSNNPVGTLTVDDLNAIIDQLNKKGDDRDGFYNVIEKMQGNPGVWSKANLADWGDFNLWNGK
ncbi:MAG: hypothetical protein AB7P76_09895 [Candidatus Melainabacteria bacterium]